jgi:hypothetical protein
MLARAKPAARTGAIFRKSGMTVLKDIYILLVIAAYDKILN